MASLRIHLLPTEETVRIVSCVLIGLLLGMSAGAQQAAAPSKSMRELTAMLNQFMRDASNNNASGFERFFADNVIYTGSNGQVHTKTEMMRSLSAAKPASATEEKQTYSAEDIVVHDFGDTAIVAFQLVARTQHADGKTEIARYRDTGTFLRRNGRWQVIAWQATKMPEKEAAK
jgi:ketosteroid isomerase-like protein